MFLEEWMGIIGLMGIMPSDRLSAKGREDGSERTDPADGTNAPSCPWPSVVPVSMVIDRTPAIPSFCCKL